MELGVRSEVTKVIFSSVQVIVEKVICAASASIGRPVVLCGRVLTLPHLLRLLVMLPLVLPPLLLVLLVLPTQATLRMVLVLASVLCTWRRLRLRLAVRPLVLELSPARLCVRMPPSSPASIHHCVLFTFQRRSRRCATVLEEMVGAGRCYVSRV